MSQATEVEQLQSAPALPPELEREIFEITARIYQGTAVRLVLIARRVQVWIEKVIYESVTLSDPTVCERFLRTTITRPASFFTTHVKSLCVPVDIECTTAEQILRVCQGVDNLAFWILGGPPLFHLVSSLRPKQLSINIRGLLGISTQPDFSHPFFAGVTHLEFVDRWTSWTTWSGFEFLTHLTHLAIDFAYYSEEDEAFIARRLCHILDSCHSLLVCLVLVPDDEDMFHASKALSSEIDDPRLVVLSDSEPVDNWEACLRAGNDVSQWAFAEEIVAVRSANPKGIGPHGLVWKNPRMS